MSLRLVVQQGDETIQQYKMDQKPLYLTCKRCKHHWKTTIGEVSDLPECPKCGS